MRIWVRNKGNQLLFIPVNQRRTLPQSLKSSFPSFSGKGIPVDYADRGNGINNFVSLLRKAASGLVYFFYYYAIRALF
jgi:hypothetical protein